MSRTFDWSPVNDENVEVNPPQNPSRLPPGIHTFQLESANSTSISACQSFPEASSPTSSESSFSLENNFPSEPDIVRRGDPARPPRPRNAFIFFRCDYTRIHTKPGKRVRRRPGTNTEKTLSKRAAEAWHQLPEEEKNHWRELSEREKEEHARLHPNYRFCPAKRGTVQKKRGAVQEKKPTPLSRSGSQPLIPSLTTEYVAEPIALPQPSQEQGVPTTQPPSQPPQLVQPPVDIALVKAGRRRSASVPLLAIGGYHQFMSGEWAAAQPPKSRMTRKRSRSVLETRPPSLSMSNTASPYEAQSFDSRMVEVDPSSGYVVPEASFGTVHDNTFQGTLPYSYEYHPSESITTDMNSIHLPSWNNEIQAPEATTPWSSSPPSELQLLQSQGSFSESEYICASSDASGMNDIMVDYSHEDQWAPTYTEYPYSSVQASLGLDNSGMLFSPRTVYNSNVAAAPYESSQAVGACATIENQIPEEAMFALNINDYLHYAQ
ncbi:hypothetical protein H2248_010106 [Termitomyces sp. 'cryptogamus']|nr:hypothetical protein H2248_010106 [Termitomyces sp. 'cryptogamus']